MAAAGGLGLEANDRRDLDRDPERQLAGSQRLPGMPPAFAEDFVDQVGGAVEDLRLLFEAGGGADEAAELDELLDAVERPGMLANQRHDVQGANLGGSGGVLDADVGADNPAEL